MRSRTYMLSTFALSAAIVLGIPASAADLPKEGAYKGTYFAHGTYKTNQLTKDRLVMTFDETGLQVTDGFFDHATVHCWGMTEYIKGMGEDQTYCLATDPSGDKSLWKFSSEKHAPDQKRFKGKTTCLEGTGKYVGLMCDENDLIMGNEFAEAPEGTYVQYVTFEGTYKLQKPKE
jgi:hypothetical protein